MRISDWSSDVCSSDLFGVGRFMDYETFIAWGKADGCGIALTKPFDGNPATVGNGVMAAFQADSREMVDRVFAKAIALGARDEGPAGPRGDGGFSAGSFPDPDGNKLNVFLMEIGRASCRGRVCQDGSISVVAVA